MTNTFVSCFRGSNVSKQYNIVVIMNFIKLVISVDHCNVFSIELAFNILQRRVFADNKLDVFILTLDVDEVKETTEHIKNCCFSNLNELIVTGDYHDAFLKADCLLLMTNLNLPDRKVLENVKNLEHVFKKAKSFDLLANPDARVVVMGPWSNTWLQIFAEVTTRLRKCNFTGLSRHHVSKALGLIARKLDESIQTATTYRHCVISAVCHHIIDWYRGTGDRTVCMMISVHQPGNINDGVFSSYPVVIGQSGQMSVRNIETDALYFIKLYRYLEVQQRERCIIQNYIKYES